VISLSESDLTHMLLQIPSLCLHSRITEADPTRPTNELSFTGVCVCV